MASAPRSAVGDSANTANRLGTKPKLRRRPSSSGRLAAGAVSAECAVNLVMTTLLGWRGTALPVPFEERRVPGHGRTNKLQNAVLHIRNTGLGPLIGCTADAPDARTDLQTGQLLRRVGARCHRGDRHHLSPRRPRAGVAAPGRR